MVRFVKPKQVTLPEERRLAEQPEEAAVQEPVAKPARRTESRSERDKLASRYMRERAERQQEAARRHKKLAREERHAVATERAIRPQFV